MERWKDIIGYEGYYQVSDAGRVRSCDRYLPAANGGKQIRRGQIIQPNQNGIGYLYVGLRRDGIRKNEYIHRLVAQSFIGNPNGLPQVNHKDENKANNRADNLEWCTNYYNNNYGTAKARSRKTLKCENAIPVAQVLDGIIIAVFKSASDAEKATGINSSSIRKCCLGKPRYKTAGGYSWKNI